MRPPFALLAPDQQVYPRQCQTGGRIHRPDNGNPSHRRPVICIGRVRGSQTSLFASSKVGAAPQTWYRGSRSMIATKPCSLMMVSPTATTRHGSVPVGGGGLFLTGCGLRTLPGPLKWFNCVFCAKYCSASPDPASGRNFFYGERRAKFPEIFRNAEKGNLFNTAGVMTSLGSSASSLTWPTSFQLVG